MTFLTMINQVQDQVGLPRVTASVAASTDPNVRRLVALANIEGDELAKRHPWQALLKEQTFTGTAADVQVGAIPSDVDRYVVESFFNRTKRRRLVGPLGAQEWQLQKALTASVITDAFRIRGDDFMIIPTPSTADTYAYEYVSTNWCQSSGGDGQTAWSADDDITATPEYLMVLGTIWRWLKSNGLEFGEDFNTYERAVNTEMQRDGSRRTINFSSDESLWHNAYRPTVPEGSWSL